MVFVSGFGLFMPNFLHFRCCQPEMFALLFLPSDGDQLQNHWKTCHCEVSCFFLSSFVRHCIWCCCLCCHRRSCTTQWAVCLFVSYYPLSKKFSISIVLKESTRWTKSFRAFLIIIEAAAAAATTALALVEAAKNSKSSFVSPKTMTQPAATAWLSRIPFLLTKHSEHFYDRNWYPRL